MEKLKALEREHHAARPDLLEEGGGQAEQASFHDPLLQGSETLDASASGSALPPLVIETPGTAFADPLEPSLKPLYPALPPVTPEATPMETDPDDPDEETFEEGDRDPTLETDVSDEEIYLLEEVVPDPNVASDLPPKGAHLAQPPKDPQAPEPKPAGSSRPSRVRSDQDEEEDFLEWTEEEDP